jgi:hypothetical protein
MTGQVPLFDKLEALELPLPREPEDTFIDDLLAKHKDTLQNIQSVRAFSNTLVLTLNGKAGGDYHINKAFAELERSLYEACAYEVAKHYGGKYGVELDVYKFMNANKAITRDGLLKWVNDVAGGTTLEEAALNQLRQKFTFRRTMPAVTKNTVTMRERVSYYHASHAFTFSFSSRHGEDLEQLVHFLNTGKVAKSPPTIFDTQHGLTYDPYPINGPVVTSLQLYKNGSVKLTFTSESGVTKFLATFVNT